MKFSFCVLAFCFIVSVVFTGCDKISDTLNPNWLVGTWEVDRQQTMASFETNHQKETPTGGIAGQIAAAAIRKTVDVAISSQQDKRFVFTDDEFLEGKPGEAAKQVTYEIVNRPDADQIKILDSAGNVRIYYRELDRIWYYLTDKEKFQIYLKKVE